MKITKFGHSCLLVEEQDVRILTDPGSYSTLQNDVKNLDIILITHKHQDHLSFESLEIILKNNPQVKIFTNQEVLQELASKNIAGHLLGDHETITLKQVLVEGFGKDHATISSSLPTLHNTGYLIQERLFIPGDSFTVPTKPVEILGLPVCAPWCKLSEVIEYAKKIKPKEVFPIHDSMLKIVGGFYWLPSEELPKEGIKWRVIKEGQSEEF